MFAIDPEFTIISLKDTELTMYSVLNSCSAKNNRRSSHESSKAVKIGSFDDRAMREGLASALYELILERECFNESSCLEFTQSSQPHLENQKRKRIEWLFGGNLRHVYKSKINMAGTIMEVPLHNKDIEKTRWEKHRINLASDRILYTGFKAS